MGQSTPFTTEKLAAIHDAYAATCASLGLSTTADKITAIVAFKVLEAAKAGEFDAKRLTEAALAQLRGQTGTAA
jgi:hypothetical protein